ncbi:zinc ribbon domain-containing protein [bacterium]|nr:zinc ribbon domain-containing protein [bacterium]
MLSKIDRKVRHLLTSHTGEFEIPADIKKNPLVSYLRLFQNQHKVISVLYKGLITAFTGFVLLLSLLIFNVLHNDLVPLWGAFLLGIMDVFLLFGIYKAFRELLRYREKSTQITEQIYLYLKKDLDKLERIQLEHAFIKDSQKQVKKSLQRSSGSSIPIQGREHEGWDFKSCPHCGASIEMLAEKCPHCQHEQESYLEN